jgi:N-acetylglucosamine-6-phosphate deacetylase
MANIAYINGRVLQGRGFQSGLAVVVSGSNIVSIDTQETLEQNQYEIVDLDGNYLLPGFIDTQVNGGGGVLFNDSPDLDGIKTIVKAHRQFGSTGMLLTLISDDLDVVQKGIAAVNTAVENGVPGVLGIHIEGPFLNADKRGIHDISKIMKLTADIVRQLEPVKGGCSLLTVAPETLDPVLIGELKRKGFIISAGHTDASYAEVGNAIQHGVTGFTHLFNAMSQLGAREPGVVGAALDHDKTWCGVIADGFHVSAASLRIAYRCKGPQGIMLVTDAMPPVGSVENEFFLMGNRITVKNGVCIDANGTLAGAALDMATAVRNMMEFTNCSLAEASVMASTSPAAFLGLQNKTGRIEVGLKADFVVLDAQMRVVKTVIGGQV